MSGKSIKKVSSDHIFRVNEELRAAGVTRYGFMKSATKRIPQLLHDNEHIGGVVYGQIGSGNSAMLIATDRRVVYIDSRTIYTTTDEISYTAVSGVKINTVGPFTSIVLHTRVKEYSMRYVNGRCARIFVDYIERMRLETSQQSPAKSAPNRPDIPEVISDDITETFLRKHDLAVLSTIDRSGDPHGATVHYLVGQSNYIYILTRSETQKGKNVYSHDKVALTIYEESNLQTLQITGSAEVETDTYIKDDVISKIFHLKKYTDQGRVPPVAKNSKGSFMVIKITPSSMSFHDYAK